MSKPTLIAFIGLPRSGKSTLCAELSKDLKAPIVRRDAIRLALTGERYLAPTEPMVKVISTYMIRSLFLAGHDTVICDETNFSSAARNSLNSPDWTIVWYPMLTPLKECQRRAVSTNQPDLVPVIEEMWNRWEPMLTFGSVYLKSYGKGDYGTQPINEAAGEIYNLGNIPLDYEERK